MDDEIIHDKRVINFLLWLAYLVKLPLDEYSVPKQYDDFISFIKEI